MLWNHVLGINDLVVNSITKRLGKCTMDNIKSTPSIVTLEVFYIFQNKRRRFVIINNLRYGEKQISLIFIFKTMPSPQTVFFGHSGNAKRLARKTGT